MFWRLIWQLIAHCNYPGIIISGTQLGLSWCYSWVIFPHLNQSSRLKGRAGAKWHVKMDQWSRARKWQALDLKGKADCRPCAFVSREPPELLESEAGSPGCFRRRAVGAEWEVALGAGKRGRHQGGPYSRVVKSMHFGVRQPWVWIHLPSLAILWERSFHLSK